VILKLNPFGAFKGECEKILLRTLSENYPEFKAPKFLTETPSNQRFGELTTTVCFDLAKTVGVNPVKAAEKIVEEFSAYRPSLLSVVENVGGYVNFRVNHVRLAELTFEALRGLKADYGLLKTDKPERIIVEHTSANPNGPLHIGTARNSILGDALARILKARGHLVRRHFYVNDMGRQIAILTYGFKLLNSDLKVEGKPDEMLGFIYTATNAALEVRSLKEKLKTISEEAEKLRRLLDEYIAILAELENQHREALYKIIDGVNEDPDPQQSIDEILRLYEAGEKVTVRLIRRIVSLCLKGFRETLKTAGIFFDQWDWESSLVWSGKVSKVLSRLRKTGYVEGEGGVLLFNVENAAKDLNIKTMLNYGGELPALTLTRRDGTTLYTTRDIAYHLEKFEWADKAVNVIGVDQRLAQMQLKVALLTLGVRKAAEGLVHCAYELVKLPGYRMSRRRGRYITFDELLREAEKLAYEEVNKRSSSLAENVKRRIAREVGLGAIKYAMLNVSPSKVVVFTWDRVLNFEANSGPYIQYAYARASNILRKAGIKKLPHPNPETLKHPLERKLIIEVSRFPEIFCEAADELKPEHLTQYANGLAEVFNAFYDNLPVLKAEKAVKASRLWLVKGVKTVLGNTLRLLGIPTPKRM
jgi:arginyl-tRNA synthetase